MEQYSSMIGVMGAGSGGSGGSSNPSPFSKWRAIRKTLFIILGTVVVMQLLHYRSMSKLMKEYSDVGYETTKVHPYNHCVEIVSSRMVGSGSKIDVEKIEAVCKALRGGEDVESK